MIPLSTIKLLRAWAAWGEAQSIDYPRRSPMFGERALKTPLFGTGHIPEGVAEMEAAVCALTFEERDIIIQRWQRHKTFSQIAHRWGYSRWQIRRRVTAAESELHRLLEQIFVKNAATSCKTAPSGVSDVSLCKIATERSS